MKVGTTRNLFGEKIVKDRLDRQKKLKYLILPDSKFKMTWNLIIMVLLLYTAIYVPFKVAFINEKDGLAM